MRDINGSKPTSFPLDEEKLSFKIPCPDRPPREKILKLGSMITNRIGLKATADDPEYWGLDALVTDEMADVALKMGVRKPKTIFVSFISCSMVLGLPFSSESSRLVRFHLEKGLLRLQASDIDFATSAKESIACEYAGTTMDIGFKGDSVCEILNNLSSDEVTVQLADPSRAGVFVPVEQPENQEILMLMMPMLLND